MHISITAGREEVDQRTQNIDSHPADEKDCGKGWGIIAQALDGELSRGSIAAHGSQPIQDSRGCSQGLS